MTEGIERTPWWECWPFHQEIEPGRDTVKRFKVEWEMPDNADAPKFYEADGSTPLKPGDWPKDVPWHLTSRESEDVGSIQDQYHGLKEMTEQGHPIRNIKVYQSEVTWTEMKAK